MTTQGDEYLEQELETAIEATSKHMEEGVCKAHDGIRQGVNVLLRCKKSEMDGSPAMGGGKVSVIAGGIGAVLIGVVEAIKALIANPK
jgi:hypothetical protein